MEKDKQFIRDVIENDREWRRYIVAKLDKMDEDLQGFKIKTITFFTVITAAINVCAEYLRHK